MRLKMNKQDRFIDQRLCYALPVEIVCIYSKISVFSHLLKEVASKSGYRYTGKSIPSTLLIAEPP